MTQIDKRIKVKKLNTGSNTLILPTQRKGNEGNVGKFYENHLVNKGFDMNTNQGVDIPDLNVEVKTRNRDSSQTNRFT